MSRYRAAVDELHDAENEYMERKEAMYVPSAVRLDIIKSGQSYYDGRMDKQLFYLERLEKEIEEQRKNVTALRAINEAAIKAMRWRTETRASTVMRLFYVDLLSNEEICVRMYEQKWKNPANRKGLLRKVNNDRKRGLEMLQRILPTEAHFHAGAGVLPDMALSGDWWRESRKECVEPCTSEELITSDSEVAWRKPGGMTYRDSLYVRRRDRRENKTEN